MWQSNEFFSMLSLKSDGRAMKIQNAANSKAINWGGCVCWASPLFRKCHNIAASLEICFRSPQRSHVHHQCGEWYPKVKTQTAEARCRTHMKSKLFANGCFRELLYLSPISPSSSCLTSSACENGLSLCLLKTLPPQETHFQNKGCKVVANCISNTFSYWFRFFCRSAEPVFSPLPTSSTSFATFLRGGQSFTASFAGQSFKNWGRRAIFYRLFLLLPYLGSGGGGSGRDKAPTHTGSG